MKLFYNSPGKSEQMMVGVPTPDTKESSLRALLTFTLSAGPPRSPPGITWGQGADRNVLAHPPALAMPLCPCVGEPRDRELFQVSYLGGPSSPELQPLRAPP